MGDRAGHAVSSRERGTFSHMGDREDRTALQRRLADTQVSIQGRLKRIESEVGSAPKAVWAGAKKHPVVSALAVLAAGLLVGRMISRKRRRTSQGTKATGISGLPAASGAPGGWRSLLWTKLLQTGFGLAADYAADFLAGRSGAASRIFREKREDEKLKKSVPYNEGGKTCGKSQQEDLPPLS